MGERRGYDTDKLSISELFRDRPDLRDDVIENYLEPRARRNEREKLDDRRDHFWTVPLTATPQQRAAAAKSADPLVLLVESRLRALKDTDWVSKATAAVYCGCSEPELDRRIRTKTIGGLLTLAKKRETKRPRKRDVAGDLISGNITERQFKMSAVKRIKNTRVSHRKGGAAEPASAAAKGRPLTLKAALKNGALVLTLRKAMLDRVPWITDANGDLVCHLTLTGLSATVVAGFLAAGGTIERLTLHDALMERRWVFVDERAPWSTGYAVLLGRAQGDLIKVDAVARGRDTAAYMPRATASGNGTRF